MGWVIRLSALGAAVWGLNASANAYRESGFREARVVEAKKYGSRPASVTSIPTRIAVFVHRNTGRNGSKLLDRDVLPLFHLGGVDATIVNVYARGHARELAAGLDLSKTDSVVIVGGDGLVHEVVSGLLTREDKEKARELPIGIIPAGRANTFASALGLSGESDARAAGEATLTVLRGVTAPVDIVRVSEPTRVSYSLAGVSMGLPAAIAERAREPGWIESPRYTWAAFKTILRGNASVQDGVVAYGCNDGSRSAAHGHTDALAVTQWRAWGDQRTLTHEPIAAGRLRLLESHARPSPWDWISLIKDKNVALEDLTPLNKDVDWVSWTARTTSTFTIDGEPYTTEHWRAEVEPAAIRVYVPS